MAICKHRCTLMLLVLVHQCCKVDLTLKSCHDPTRARSTRTHFWACHEIDPGTDHQLVQLYGVSIGTFLPSGNCTSLTQCEETQRTRMRMLKPHGNRAFCCRCTYESQCAQDRILLWGACTALSAQGGLGRVQSLPFDSAAV